MTLFDPLYFKPFKPSPHQINRYFESALRDLEIAREDHFIEVRFSYCYQALIKAGIALFAKAGHVKVRSVPGHHVKILEKMSEVLKNEDINVIGNAMRSKRNLDLYEGGIVVGENEVKDYIRFVESIVESVRKVIDDAK